MSALDYNAKPGAVLAIDAGGTSFKSALIDGDGGIVPGSFYQCPVCSDGALEAVLATYVELIRHALSRGMVIGGIGVSTPGPFDYQRGVSLMKHKFACLYGISLKDSLVKLLPALAGIPFCFRHDANSFLAGERWQGAGQGCTRIGGITLGTGIGVSFFADGQFFNNELGSPATEVSLWNKPYRDGIVEDFISARALIAAYQKYNPHYDSSAGAKGIADAAKSGEQQAVLVYEQLGTDLGKVLTPWCDHFNPEKIVFGGQIAASFDLFAVALQQNLQTISCQPELQAGTLGSNSALFGLAAEGKGVSFSKGSVGSTGEKSNCPV